MLPIAALISRRLVETQIQGARADDPFRPDLPKRAAATRPAPKPPECPERSVSAPALRRA